MAVTPGDRAELRRLMAEYGQVALRAMIFELSWRADKGLSAGQTPESEPAARHTDNLGPSGPGALGGERRRYGDR